MVFYNPITINIASTPVIIYPCLGIEKLFDRSKPGEIGHYIAQLFKENKIGGKYNILILWNDGKDVMVDCWIYDQIESWGSGPLVDVKIFRNKKPESSTGVSAGNGLALLGIEEQYRWKKRTLDEYLNGPRPKLPKKISPNEDYYGK